MAGALRGTTRQSGNSCLCCQTSGALAAAARQTPNIRFAPQRATFNLPNVLIVCSWLLFLWFLYTAPLLSSVFCKFLVWLMPFWDNYWILSVCAYKCTCTVCMDGLWDTFASEHTRKMPSTSPTGLQMYIFLLDLYGKCHKMWKTHKELIRKKVKYLSI